MIQRHWRWSAVAALAFIALAGVVWPLVASRTAPARQIVLVARGMAFSIDGDDGQTNPTVSLRAGESVRFVVRNETPGIVHDFAIPAWNVAIDPLDRGESGSVTVTVPETPGRVEYLCRPHAAMMRGTLDVGPTTR